MLLPENRAQVLNDHQYAVNKIFDGVSFGYKAVIPSMNGIVFGDTLDELNEGITFAIEEEANA